MSLSGRKCISGTYIGTHPVLTEFIALIGPSLLYHACVHLLLRFVHPCKGYICNIEDALGLQRSHVSLPDSPERGGTGDLLRPQTVIDHIEKAMVPHRIARL